MERGICLVIINVDDRPSFAPSRFIGYANNTRDSHQRNPSRDGRITNDVIKELLGSEPSPNQAFEHPCETSTSRLVGERGLPHLLAAEISGIFVSESLACPATHAEADKR